MTIVYLLQQKQRVFVRHSEGTELEIGAWRR